MFKPISTKSSSIIMTSLHISSHLYRAVSRVCILVKASTVHRLLVHEPEEQRILTFRSAQAQTNSLSKLVGEFYLRQLDAFVNHAVIAVEFLVRALVVQLLSHWLSIKRLLIRNSPTREMYFYRVFAFRVYSVHSLR